MPAKVGFLTVRRHEEHGYFGGYLVVNHLARPLEFHCTLPVKPTRAQTVLYGPTIEDFVCGEQIASALVHRSKVTPDLVVTDSTPVLSLSLVSELPIVQVEPDDHCNAQDSRDGDVQTLANTLHLPQTSRVGTAKLAWSGAQFVLPEGRKSWRPTVEKVLSELGEQFDIREPFTRIVEALLEAHPTTKAA